MKRHWLIGPSVTFLNHGSFGACPRVVLEVQGELRARMESDTMRFFVRELDPLLDQARAALGGLVGADPDDLAFVPNATAGVNAVVRSFALDAGDDVLTTDHEYNACRNALTHAATVAGARVVVARVPFPVASDEEIVDAIVREVGPRTRLALVDHVTSPTGLVWPIARIVHALEERGVATVVDGAHAPGMVPLDLRAIGASYYTGNCHKWLCAPKGAAFLWARRDRQAGLRPTSISHGFNSPRRDRSQFRLDFDWTGTLDPTAALSVPAAIRFLSGALPGGIEAVMASNRAKALAARSVIAAAFGSALPAPDSMIGSLAAVRLPDSPGEPSKSPLYADALQEALYAEHRIEVPIVPWPAAPHRLVRISAHLYNEPAEYERLVGALRALLAAGH